MPKLRVIYTGIFGKILKGSRGSQEIGKKGHLQLETFEGQVVEMRFSLTDGMFLMEEGHLVLVIFSNQNGRGEKPWCVIDWTRNNNTCQYFEKKILTTPVRNNTPIKKKNSISNSWILFGLISIFGLCGLLFAISPAVQLF